MPEPTTTDPRWPELLSVMVHDIRTPMTVINGYLDMLLKERFGPVNEKQRHLLEEIRKQYIKVYGILAESSELTSIERGRVTYTRKPADLHQLLRAAIEQLPPVPDRDVPVELETSPGEASIDADAARLTKAFCSVIAGVRREAVMADRLLVREQRSGTEYQIRIGDDETVASFDNVAIADLPVFDEWRGGVGMTLAVARRILNGHDAHIAAPPEGRKTGAVILLRR